MLGGDALFWGLYGLVGAVAGVLAGLLGVGGGLVIVPALTYLFEAQGMPAEATLHLALGTSLASILFTSVSSVRAHQQHGAVDWSIVWRIAPGILAGTYAGSWVAAQLSTGVLKGVFALFLVAVAVQLSTGARPAPSRTMPQAAGTSGVGVLIGAVSGLVGIGGGSLSVPFMIWCNVEIRRAIGTSAAIGFPIALAGTVGYVAHGLGAASVPGAAGYVYLPALAGVALLSVLTAPLGARLAHRLEPGRVKRIFGLFLIVMSLRMSWDALAPLVG
jgi:uncharacterized membrane protein YfcA